MSNDNYIPNEAERVRLCEAFRFAMEVFGDAWPAGPGENAELASEFMGITYASLGGQREDGSISECTPSETAMKSQEGLESVKVLIRRLAGIPQISR